MMHIDADIIRAAECTYNWLEYLGKVSQNSRLIAESALKYPFVEYLERHGIKNIHIETGHPLFKRKQMDLYIGKISDNNIANILYNPSIYVEFKYVRGDVDTRNEKQRYLDDLLRLSCFKRYNKSASCYFIVYGETLLFKGQFQNSLCAPSQKAMETSKEIKRTKQKGWFSKLLSFNRVHQEKSETLSKNKYKEYIASFHEDYIEHMRDGVSSIDCSNLQLTTRLLLLSSSRSLDSTYSVGVWEVL